MKKFIKKHKKGLESLTAGQLETDNFLERKRLMKVNRFLSDYKVITIVYWIVIALIFCAITYILMSLSGAGLSDLLLHGEITYRQKFSFRETIIENRILYLFLLPLSIVLYFKILYDVRVSFGSLDVGQGGHTSRWTMREELEEQYKKIPDKNDRFPGRGGPPIARDGDFLYIDDGAVSNLVIGTSRSGKGEEHMFPSIDIYSRAEEQASMLITDPKLELAPASIPTLIARGYDCYVLNLIDPEYSMHFNSLPVIVQEMKEKEYPTAQQLCRSLCFNIIAPDPNEKDPYWSDQARNVLIAGIMADIEDNLAADEEINRRRLHHHKKTEAQNKRAAIETLGEENAALYLIKEESERLMDEEPTLTYFGLLTILQNTDLPPLAKEVINKMDINDFPNYLRQKKPSINYYESSFVPTTENEEKINLYSIVRMINTLYATPIDKNRTALDFYFSERDENNFARQTYSSIGSIPNTGNTKGTIMSVFQQKTSIFLYDNIGRMMAKNDLDFIDMGFGKKPIAVFIGLPDYDTSNHFIATVFINQLYFTLSKMATAMPSKRTLRDVAFLLDEFGNLPPLDNMESIVSVGLGRGMRFHFIIQALSQLDAKYGEQTAKTIKGNCGNQKYILTTDSDTAKAISEDLGSENYVSVNRTGKKMSLNKEQTEMTENRPLLSPRQLMELKPAETVVLRYLKREDNEGNPVRATPIGNLGPYHMKFRWQYLSDSFPSGKILYRSRNMERIIKHNSDIAYERFELADVKMPNTSAIDLKRASRSGKAYTDNLYFRQQRLCAFAEQNPNDVYRLFELMNVPAFERAELLSPESSATVSDLFDYAYTLINTGQPIASAVGYEMLDILSPIDYDSRDEESEDDKAAKAFEAAGLSFDIGNVNGGALS